MTKNEYIASIMLEAAELLKEDNEYNDDEYKIDDILTEAAEYDYDNIYYLNEAVDELKEIDSIKKEIKNSKDIDEKKLSTKIKNIINNTLKWYYKIEPNKKFKALHTVLRVLSKLIILLLGITYIWPAYIIGSSTYSITSDFKDIATGKFDRFSWATRQSAASALYIILTSALVALSKSIKQYSNIKFNISDYDNNVKEIQSQINIIDKHIKKSNDNKQINHLNKLKNEYNNMLKDLRNMKEKYDKKNK